MNVGIAGMGHVTTEPDTAGGDVCKVGLPLYVLNVSLQTFFINFYFFFTFVWIVVVFYAFLLEKY